VLAAVRALSAQVRIMLCTGRTVLGVGHVLDHLGLTSGLTVCSNGAVVLDTATRAVVRTASMDPTPMVAAVRAVLPGAVVGCEETGVGQRISAPFPEGILAGRVRVVPPAELVGTPTPKVIAHWAGHTPAEVAARMAGVVVPGAEYTLDHEMPWVTMVPAGVSKASALAAVAAEHGVAQEDVLAVGDGDNDRAMLRWAGLGVAMGQAPDSVKADADEVTAPVWEDGLALVVERFL
jgi:hydroxymethylpyrimidine pyrophosphatase-like HAD family hydrolase